jgi:hypothetical protein
MSKFYNGIPEETWNDLLFNAEDLLRDEDLGTHIVGVYPIGSAELERPSQPGIMCLYIDSVDSLLDPSSFPRNSTIKHDTTGSIYMWDLYYWTRIIIIHSPHVFDPIIKAPFNDIIHEDESISSIIYTAREFLNNRTTGKGLGKLVAQLYRSLS